MVTNIGFVPHSHTPSLILQFTLVRKCSRVRCEGGEWVPEDVAIAMRARLPHVHASAIGARLTSLGAISDGAVRIAYESEIVPPALCRLQNKARRRLRAAVVGMVRGGRGGRQMGLGGWNRRPRLRAGGGSCRPQVARLASWQDAVQA